MEHIFEQYLSGNMEKIYEIDAVEIDNNTNTRLSQNIFSNIRKYAHPEYQYLNLVEQILENGLWEHSRNGNTKSIFGHSMRFSLQNGTIPIITTKKTAWKTCLKELLWFISGNTNNNILQKQGVTIWNANASRDFLYSRGLDHYKDGELGPIYGHQWRHFGAPWNSENENDSIITGIDQLQNIIDQLQNVETRGSRRLIMSAWNPQQLDEMVLPPLSYYVSVQCS